MAAVVPGLVGVGAGQTQVGLVHECGGLQGLTRGFVGQSLRRQSPQLVVDEWQELARAGLDSRAAVFGEGPGSSRPSSSREFVMRDYRGRRRKPAPFRDDQGSRPVDERRCNRSSNGLPSMG